MADRPPRMSLIRRRCCGSSRSNSAQPNFDRCFTVLPLRDTERTSALRPASMANKASVDSTAKLGGALPPGTCSSARAAGGRRRRLHRARSRLHAPVARRPARAGDPARPRRAHERDGQPLRRGDALKRARLARQAAHLLRPRSSASAAGRGRRTPRRRPRRPPARHGACPQLDLDARTDVVVAALPDVGRGAGYQLTPSC
jgi:hypothetical protein